MNIYSVPPCLIVSLDYLSGECNVNKPLSSYTLVSNLYVVIKSG